MNQDTDDKIPPIPTLERLATYLRFLIDLEQSNVDTISSAEVERQTGVNAAQFRKDLNWFGDFGKPGVGYNVQDLHTRIARILKIDREQRIILVGAGNLGSALVGYPGLQEHHFNLVAVFDNNYGKIGRPLWNLEIQDVQRLKEVNSTLGARIAILAVPASAAQKVTDLLVEAGIRAILNFAPVLLRKPDNVYVRNVSFLQELAVLSFHLSDETPGEHANHTITTTPSQLISSLTDHTTLTNHTTLQPTHQPSQSSDHQPSDHQPSDHQPTLENAARNGVIPPHNILEETATTYEKSDHASHARNGTLPDVAPSPTTTDISIEPTDIEPTEEGVPSPPHATTPVNSQ